MFTSLKIAVNVSPVQFRNPGLVRGIAASLEASGLSPDRLELEITETALLQGSETTLGMRRPDAARIALRQALDIFERLGVPEAESARIRIEAMGPALSGTP